MKKLWASMSWLEHEMWYEENGHPGRFKRQDWRSRINVHITQDSAKLLKRHGAKQYARVQQRASHKHQRLEDKREIQEQLTETIVQELLFETVKMYWNDLSDKIVNAQEYDPDPDPENTLQHLIDTGYDFSFESLCTPEPEMKWIYTHEGD